MYEKFFIFLALYLTILYADLLSANYEYDLAIGVISRDDEAYLKEWIEFHKLVGVQHFYIYCHGNWRAYQEVLKEYIAIGEVDLLSPLPYFPYENQKDIAVFNQIQCQTYTNLAKTVSKKVKWLALIDTDEYLFPVKEDNLVHFLSSFEKEDRVGGVCVNWQTFGTSGIEKIPADKTMIELLVHCADENNQVNFHVKSIVRPERVDYFINPHYAIYHPNYLQVNTDNLTFIGPFSPYIQIDKLRINHYYTRDQRFFYCYKIPRRRNWLGSTERELADFIQHIEIFCNKQTNTNILRFVAPLRMKLKISSKK